MPLAHILAPQVAQKAQEIEAQLGHTSYLQKSSSAPPLRGEGAMFVGNDAPKYDPADPKGAYIQAYSTLPKGYEGMRRGMMRGTTVPTVMPMPSAPVPELGAEITKNARGQLVINAEPGAPIGVKERGGAVDIRGKKVGYLDGSRTADRKPSDVRMRGEKDAPTRLEDKFSNDVRGVEYDKNLKKYKMEFKDYKDNDYRWPKGYFEGVKAKDAKRMRQAVEDMAAFETDINTQTKKPNTF